MFINEGSVKVELDFHECWNIGNSLLNNMMKQTDIDHWKNHEYSKYLERNSNELRMARQFCNFSNPEWGDCKLKEFREKLDKAKSTNK